QLLKKRFNSVPPETVQRISAISAEDLIRLGERLLSARSLEELGLA
ncbi:MAG: hypothetical protein QOJ16_4145, partial [Acidobacteriota bacterium]|nr:hypothetical protein [Acidobacteriota bacterium]